MLQMYAKFMASYGLSFMGKGNRVAQRQGSLTLTIRSSHLMSRCRSLRARLAAEESAACELSVRKLGL